MAKKRPSSTSPGSHARDAVRDGEKIRERVRDATAQAIRDRKLTFRQLSGLVEEVLEGAAEGVKEAMPKSPSSVMRQVVEGLSDAVAAVASAGAGAARSAKERGAEFAKRVAPAASEHLHAANEELFKAVGAFAKKTSGEVRAELDDLVDRARRAAPKVRAGAKDALDATEGRFLELTGEAARVGVTVARRAVGNLALAASGLMEGLAEAISPKSRPASAPKPGAAQKAEAKPRKPAAKRGASAAARGSGKKKAAKSR